MPDFDGRGPRLRSRARAGGYSRGQGGCNKPGGSGGWKLISIVLDIGKLLVTSGIAGVVVGKAVRSLSDNRKRRLSQCQEGQEILDREEGRALGKDREPEGAVVEAEWEEVR